MDITKEWKKLETEFFNQPPLNKESIMNAITKESSSTIVQLKKLLKVKMNWILFFIGLFLIGGAISLLKSIELAGLFGFFIILYGIGYLFMYQEYKKIEVDIISGANTTLAMMKKNAQIIKRVLDTEQYLGLFLFPTAMIAGIIGVNLALGASLSEVFSNTKMMVATLVGIVVFVPILYALTKKMNAFAYGGFQKSLEENIRKMETTL